MGQWHVADEYDGQVREITFRSLCNSPMCPPDTAMTEYQHAVLSLDKKMLVLMHISSFYCGVNSVWVYELYLLIKKGCDFLSLLWSTYLSLVVNVLVSYFSFSTSSWVPYFYLIYQYNEFSILLGVWDRATGTWCSIWVLLWGIQYFVYLVLYCNICIWLGCVLYVSIWYIHEFWEQQIQTQPDKQLMENHIFEANAC
jgi:hypothetical protein